MTAMGPTGVPADEVIAHLDGLLAGDLDWRSGKVLSGLYHPGAAAGEVAEAAYLRYLTPNSLYVNFYPSIATMEREVVRSVADLVSGDGMVVGSVTSGGTESILLAVKTARDRARAERPSVTDPEMIIPISAHPAFLKAAHYLGVNAVQTPMEPATFRADPAAVEAAVTDQTILVVGSAPTFSHGVVDPIPQLAAIAADAGASMHVDGCVGAISLGLMRELGEAIPPFDFAVPGVTTISADLHKYGYAPKNSSVLLYRDASIRRHAWFVSTATTEYAVMNPTVQSSRTGGPVAAAWALFRHLGLEGYLEMTKSVLDATRTMIDGVQTIPGLTVLGKPVMTMFTIASEEINVFELDDAMRRRGWSLLPEFGVGGPANLHVSVSFSNVDRVEEFVADLAAAAQEVRTSPRVDVEALRSLVASVADASPFDVFAALAPHAGLTGMALPEDMAALNTMLDLLPVEVRDQILGDFANLMW